MPAFFATSPSAKAQKPNPSNPHQRVLVLTSREKSMSFFVSSSDDVDNR